MNLVVHGSFNLLLNAVASFIFSLGIVVGAVALLRLEPGRRRLLLLSLPFAKVFWDCAAGIGASSFFWQRLAGARQELGSFQIGFGVSRLAPFVRMTLGSLYRGHWYSLSAGDLLDTAITLRISPRGPAILVIVLGCISAALLARHGLSRHAFSCETTKLRSGSALWETRIVGRRQVPVLVSPAQVGAPFTGGLFRPYVLLSSEIVRRLTPAERRAVLEHELAHVAHRDVLLTAALGWALQAFWFLPGSSYLAARIRAELELRADDAAVRAGADPRALASALVVVAEQLRGMPVVSVAAGRTKGSLLARASRLLETAARPSPSSAIRLVRTLGVVLVVVCVLQSAFFGNHAAAPIAH